MKPKKTNYPLLIVVLIIWGTIVFKIFNQTKPSHPIDPGVKKPNPTEHGPSSRKDTFSLLLTYRDPFGKTTFKKTPPKKNNTPKVKPKESVVSWPHFQVVGKVGQSGGKNCCFLIKTQNKEYLVSRGTTFEGIKLAGVSPKKLTFYFKGQKKEVPLNFSSNSLLSGKN